MIREEEQFDLYRVTLLVTPSGSVSPYQTDVYVSCNGIKKALKAEPLTGYYSFEVQSAVLIGKVQHQ